MKRMRDIYNYDKNTPISVLFIILSVKQLSVAAQVQSSLR
jgi:hypothetical protein